MNNLTPIPVTNRQLRTVPDISLEDAGRIANRVAADTLFGRYLSEKSANTIKRHGRDLELFAEYMLDVGIMPEGGADFQTNPHAWRGVTWGIVEGFIQWLLKEGYAVTSVNARLSTVRIYAQMAVKAGAIDRQEGLLIQSVKGYSRQNRVNVDEQRDQTRMREVTYAYKPEGAPRTIVVNRRSTKKAKATQLSDAQAVTLQQPRNDSPQAWRDALLMRLLLDHGLRASEVAILNIANLNIGGKEMTFYRPKVKGTVHEWTTHRLTAVTLSAAAHYVTLYPPALLPTGYLILSTSRLLKSGKGGELLQEPLNRVRISERVAYLGLQVGIDKLSAHDCRHYCATKMARLGYGVDELMAWFGWTSAQTAMRYVTAVDVKERYKG